MLSHPSRGTRTNGLNPTEPTDMPDTPKIPPSLLEEPLELDPRCWRPKDIYHLQSALIVPRPIAWVSTVSTKGFDNLAPHSYFNAVCDDPPCVMFSMEGNTDTYRNITATGEFVVNFVSSNFARKLELTAVDFPAEESEFQWANVMKLPARRVLPPRVAGAKACLECQVDRMVNVGNRNHVTFGRVVHYFVRQDIWRNGRVDPHLFNPLCRLGTSYGQLGATFRMNRPKWDAIREVPPEEVLDLIRVREI